MVDADPSSESKPLSRLDLLVDEMRKRGVSAIPDHTIQNYATGQYAKTFTDSLIACLQQDVSLEDKDLYIRLLRHTNTPYDGTILTKLFEQTDNYKLKYWIMSTLPQSWAVGISDWFIRMLSDPSQGELQKMLACFIDCAKSPKQYLPTLREHYSDYPYSALRTFNKYGGKEELEFLRKIGTETFSITVENRKKYLKFLEKTITKLESKVSRVNSK